MNTNIFAFSMIHRHRNNTKSRSSSSRLTQISLQWRHNGLDGVSNHQPRDCLFSRLIRRRSKKTSKLRVTGLCAGNSPVAGEFPAHKWPVTRKISIWWRHNDFSTKAASVSADMIWYFVSSVRCYTREIQHIYICIYIFIDALGLWFR